MYADKNIFFKVDVKKYLLNIKPLKNFRPSPTSKENAEANTENNSVQFDQSDATGRRAVGRRPVKLGIKSIL